MSRNSGSLIVPLSWLHENQNMGLRRRSPNSYLQDAKDIERDELLINGFKLRGSVGYDCVVRAIVQTLQSSLKASSVWSGERRVGDIDLEGSQVVAGSSQFKVAAVELSMLSESAVATAIAAHGATGADLAPEGLRQLSGDDLAYFARTILNVHC